MYVPAWSYSTLSDFEKCPYKVWLAKVDKIPQPKHPAAERGTEIHKLAEDYVRGEIGELPKELSKFTKEFEELRFLFGEGKVEVEGDWGFDKEWAPCGWLAPTVWGRMKLDAKVEESETSARAIDYKTGRKFGNEVPHGQQAMIYAVGTFMRYPSLQFVQTEFWYLDHGQTTTQRYSREEAMLFLDGITQRALALTECVDFPPRPSKFACQWCAYAKDGNCKWSYQE